MLLSTGFNMNSTRRNEGQVTRLKKSIANKIGPADPNFVLDDYILYNLVRASATYNDEIAKALKTHGLDTVKWRILMLLHDKSPSSVGDLARRSVTKMPTLTRILIRMENENLILRQTLDEDRRIVEVTMTPKATKALRTVQEIGHRVFERAVEGVSAEEIQAMTHGLKKIRENLARSPYEILENE